MTKKSKPWHASCRWSVFTKSLANAADGRFKVGEWVEVYSSATKEQACTDAATWRERVGTEAVVVPGRGHESMRDLSEADALAMQRRMADDKLKFMRKHGSGRTRRAPGYGTAAPVCSNCGQWQHGDDCFNECVKRGFAQKAVQS